MDLMNPMNPINMVNPASPWYHVWNAVPEGTPDVSDAASHAGGDPAGFIVGMVILAMAALIWYCLMD